MSTSEDQTAQTSEPSQHDGSAETPGIDDDQLPEDLQPGEDNPLADGLDDGESVGDLLEDGKRAEESEESEASGDAGASGESGAS